MSKSKETKAKKNPPSQRNPFVMDSHLSTMETVANGLAFLSEIGPNCDTGPESHEEIGRQLFLDTLRAALMYHVTNPGVGAGYI